MCGDLFTYMHTYTVHTNAHNSQAQGLNLRRRRSLGGKRTVDINDEQTYVFKMRFERVETVERSDE